MSRPVVAEALGTGLLLYLVVGSGIAAETLARDPASLLLAHAVAVGAGLAALIALFQTVSGSHLNPAVTLSLWRSGVVAGSSAASYVVAQLLGALGGVVLANVSFGAPAFELADTIRSEPGTLIAEAIGTTVLVLAVLMLLRTGRSQAIPAIVGAWVASIVFATSSTGFANPAVTLARIFTDSFTGVGPASAGAFVIVQLIAALIAVSLAGFLVPPIRARGPAGQEARS